MFAPRLLGCPWALAAAQPTSSLNRPWARPRPPSMSDSSRAVGADTSPAGRIAHHCIVDRPNHAGTLRTAAPARPANGDFRPRADSRLRR